MNFLAHVDWPIVGVGLIIGLPLLGAQLKMLQNSQLLAKHSAWQQIVGVMGRIVAQTELELQTVTGNGRNVTEQTLTQAAIDEVRTTYATEINKLGGNGVVTDQMLTLLYQRLVADKAVPGTVQAVLTPVFSVTDPLPGASTISGGMSVVPVAAPVRAGGKRLISFVRPVGRHTV